MSKKPAFGVCAWNRWGDHDVDRPDNTDEIVLSHMVDRLVDDGQKDPKYDKVFQFQAIDPRDYVPEFDPNAGFAIKRQVAFNALVLIDPTLGDFPDLDVLFVRWRWDLGMKYDPRLVRQRATLDHYLATKTRVWVWDEDFKITDGERAWLLSHDNVTFVEMSETARRGLRGARVVWAPHPIGLNRDECLSRILGLPNSGEGDHVDFCVDLAYVGNDYERDESLVEFVNPAAENGAGVDVYGNWMKYDGRDALAKYPKIRFHPKVGRVVRDWVYRHAVAVPMLAKQEYFRLGHITPRLHEVVSAGGVPIGFKKFFGWERHYASSLMAADFGEMLKIVEWLKRCTKRERKAILESQLEVMMSSGLFDVDAFFKAIDVDP